MPKERPTEGLKSIQIIVDSFVNITSDTDLLRGVSPVERKNTVVFVELFGEGMVLEVPAKACGVGNHLGLKIRTVNARDEMSLEATGKVIKMDPCGDNRMQVRIQFVQFQKLMWEKFLRIFSERQDQIVDLFKALRGED